MSDPDRIVTVPDGIGPYQFTGRLGTGATAVVVSCVDTRNGRNVACKICSQQQMTVSDTRARFREEIDNMRRIHHPNLVALYDLMLDEENWYIFMQLGERGELLQYIQEHGRIGDDEAAGLARDMIEALACMHAKGIAHRDIKPENIFISHDGRALLGDFGLSKFVGPQGMCMTSCGSPVYVSPEFVSTTQEPPFNAMLSDLWSLGVVIYVMVEGRLPWTKRDEHELFEEIRAGKYRPLRRASEGCADFIRRVLVVDPARRLPLAQALRHAWIAAAPARAPVPPVLPPTFIGARRQDIFFEAEVPDVPPLADDARCVVKFAAVSRWLSRGSVGRGVLHR